MTDEDRQAGTQARRMLLRVAEGFFQRPAAMLAPLAFLLATGVYSAATIQPEYRSSTTFDVSSSLTASPLAGARESTTKSVAEAVAYNLAQLLYTDAFVGELVETAGIEDMVRVGAVTYLGIRGSLDVSAAGSAVVRIDATSANPDFAQQLAAAAAASFLDYVVTSDTVDLSVRVATFESRVSTARTRSRAADAELTAYVATHDVDDEDRPPQSEVDEILRLSEIADEASESLLAEQAALSAASSDLASAEAGVRRQLSLVDPTATAPRPTTDFGTSVAIVAVFAVLGVTMSVAFCLLSMRIDTTLRSPEDVRRRLRVPVLADVAGGGR